MKAKFSKYIIGAAALVALGMTSCVGDLDQLPKDQRTTTAADFKANPREYIGGAMGKCYSGLAISGQTGAGSSDMSGLDNGRSCYSRAIFMLNEFTTDECSWIWKDSGIFDLCTSTWSSNNENIFGTYSRLYCHISVCNDFMRLIDSAGTYGIDLSDIRGDVDQFLIEARVLRALSYYYVIDLFGNGAYAWDTQVTGEEPPYTTRAELFRIVTEDLEDAVKAWEARGETPVVYGRIGIDAAYALLAKFYLNSQTWGCGDRYADCWKYCDKIIKRHDTNANHGLAKDYLSLFCATNDIFAPGGSLSGQNEILWNIPYKYRVTVTVDGKEQEVAGTQSYGGSSFLILAAISDKTTQTPGWYGINGQWTCMHARKEFVLNNWEFQDGRCDDGRTYLWLTDESGFVVENTDFSTYTDGFVPIKFTNVECNADGTMPRWEQPAEQDGKPLDGAGLRRAGVHDMNNKNNFGVKATADFAETDYPVIRLAEIYLTAAEAFLRGTGVGDQASALKYVNYVRERATGCTPWNAGDLTLPNLLSERARELYWENNRRTDLVRFGMFAGGGYVWSWKNNVPTGADIPANMNIYPLPNMVINSYSGPFPQNPGY